MFDFYGWLCTFGVLLRGCGLYLCFDVVCVGLRFGFVCLMLGIEEGFNSIVCNGYSLSLLLCFMV